MFKSFSPVTEALTGLIYHRPSGENPSFVVALALYKQTLTLSSRSVIEIIKKFGLIRKKLFVDNRFLVQTFGYDLSKNQSLWFWHN